MKTSSAKAKGRNLQNFVRDYLRKVFPELTTDSDDQDIESRSMGSTGTDIILSPAAKKQIIFDFECKNQESLNIWSAIKQAEANTKNGRIPLVVFKRNRSDVYCTLKFEDLMKLLYPDRTLEIV